MSTTDDHAMSLEGSSGPALPSQNLNRKRERDEQEEQDEEEEGSTTTLDSLLHSQENVKAPKRHKADNTCCSICWEAPPSEQHTAVLPDCCDHEFCWDCIVQWGLHHENTCPLCKRRFVLLQRKQPLEMMADETCRQEGNVVDPIESSNNTSHENNTIATAHEPSSEAPQRAGNRENHTTIPTPPINNVNQLSIATRNQHVSSRNQQHSQAMREILLDLLEQENVLLQATLQLVTEHFQETIDLSESSRRAWLRRQVLTEMRVWHQRMGFVQVGFQNAISSDAISSEEEDQQDSPLTPEQFREVRHAIRFLIAGAVIETTDHVDNQTIGIHNNAVDASSMPQVLAVVLLLAVSLFFFLWSTARVLSPSWYSMVHTTVRILSILDPMLGCFFQFVWKDERVRMKPKMFWVANASSWMIVLCLTLTRPGEDGGPWRFLLEGEDASVANVTATS